MISDQWTMVQVLAWCHQAQIYMSTTTKCMLYNNVWRLLSRYMHTACIRATKKTTMMESHPYWKPRHIWPAVHIRLLGWMFYCVTLKAVHLTAFSVKGCSSVSLQCLQRWQSCCHHNTRICLIWLTFQQDHHWSKKMWHLLWPCWLPAWCALWLLWWPLRDAAMFQCVYWYQQSVVFFVFFTCIVP